MSTTAARKSDGVAGIFSFVLSQIIEMYLGAYSSWVSRCFKFASAAKELVCLSGARGLPQKSGSNGGLLQGLRQLLHVSILLLADGLVLGFVVLLKQFLPGVFVFFLVVLHAFLFLLVAVLAF